jgi:hypothetical protein
VQNGGGKGGRNYRLNWKTAPDGGATFGDWRIVHRPGLRLSWVIQYKGYDLARRHGDYRGCVRLKTVDNAKRYVERYLRKGGA